MLDPFSVSRRPMARGPAVFDVARRPATGDFAPPLFVGEVLDLAALHGLLDGAEVIIEGATYGDQGSDQGSGQFQGTALFTLELASRSGAEALALRLASALRRDPRARVALEDHCRRALARLLGPAMPVRLEVFPSARAEATRVRIDVEMEAPMDALRSAEGR